MIFQFLVRLRTYSVCFVSFVVENVACLLVIDQMVTDVHHRGTERTEDSQRALRSITHSIQRGTYFPILSPKL